MDKTLRCLVALFISITSAYSSQAQDCNCDHVISPPDSRTTSLIIDGEVMGVKAGETVCVSGGFYMQIRFTKMSGEPGHPVTIKNCGGVVEIGDAVNFGRWYAVDIAFSKYVRFTGTGVADTRYGIKLGKSGDTALKIGASTDIEVDHIDVGNANFAGIMAKTDYAGNVPANAPEMNNLNIHDNYIHDTRGEGMYIGETRTPGQDFRHLEIWNNVVTRTGLDLVQVANAIEDVHVHHNVLYKGGLRKLVGQNKGLQIGDNSVGQYYNNFIIGSASNFFIVMGSGDIDIYNNYLQGAGDPAFFIDNRSVTLMGEPINVRDNFMMEVRLTAPFINVFNEKNPVNITGNRLDGSNVDVGYGSGAGANVTVSGNSNMAIERVQFIEAATDNFALASESPYRGLGLMEDVSNRNQRPYIRLIDNQTLMAGTKRGVVVNATDPEHDAMKLEAFNLPSFVSFQDNGNGTGVFMLAPGVANIGVYYKVRVRVTDSKGGMNTQYYSITVLDPPGLSEQVRIYPNPVQDKVIIGFESEVNGLLTIQLSDRLGTPLLQSSWMNSEQTTELDINELNLLPGLYYLKVAQDGVEPKTLRMFKK
ncbi:MAG: T9SS type A sorting domain-containing protein [Cyclobacteriaceae bacterium]